MRSIHGSYWKAMPQKESHHLWNLQETLQERDFVRFNILREKASVWQVHTCVLYTGTVCESVDYGRPCSQGDEAFTCTVREVGGGAMTEEASKTIALTGTSQSTAVRLYVLYFRTWSIQLNRTGENRSHRNFNFKRPYLWTSRSTWKVEVIWPHLYVHFGSRYVVPKFFTVHLLPHEKSLWQQFVWT